MKKSQEKNFIIIHKLLAQKTYFFKFVKKSDFVLNLYYISFHALVKSNIDNISMKNFEKSFIKIRKRQLLKKIKMYKKNELFEKLNFDYENVFLEKYADIEKIKISFVVTASETDIFMNSNINNHLEFDFQRKIADILKNHQTLFRKRLGRFNDDIKIPISFRNKKNINDFKQILFSISVKNKKAMNKIIDFLIKNRRVQKIFLKTISSTAFSTFVI